jgi:hypothetical protein
MPDRAGAQGSILHGALKSGAVVHLARRYRKPLA